MTIQELLPILSLVLVLALTLPQLFGAAQKPGLWRLPAALSIAFAIFSVMTIMVEGPLGFWANHSQDFWGNQVWIDLLLAVALTWTLILPRARAQGMFLGGWFIFMVTTASIGLLAMLARLWYLEERRA
ncbi:MAG: hypothetical protein AB3N23_19565 [Paracoccaceae bacterium]